MTPQEASHITTYIDQKWRNRKRCSMQMKTKRNLGKLYLDKTNFKTKSNKRRHDIMIHKSNIYNIYTYFMASLVAQRLKRLPGMLETWVWSLGREDPQEKEMATHSSILAWRIPWREEPGRLQSMGSQRVRHTEQLTFSLYRDSSKVGLLIN